MGSLSGTIREWWSVCTGWSLYIQNVKIYILKIVNTYV